MAHDYLNYLNPATVFVAFVGLPPPLKFCLIRIHLELKIYQLFHFSYSLFLPIEDGHGLRSISLELRRDMQRTMCRQRCLPDPAQKGFQVVVWDCAKPNQLLCTTLWHPHHSSHLPFGFRACTISSQNASKWGPGGKPGVSFGDGQAYQLWGQASRLCSLVESRIPSPLTNPGRWTTIPS